MNGGATCYETDTIFPAEGTLVLLWDGLTYSIGMHDLEGGWDMSLAGRGEPAHWTYLPTPPT